jgi:phosphoribosylformylglycinamidine cyclo-ligase
MRTRKPLTYKAAGVDIAKADDFVDSIKPYVKDFFGGAISAFAGGIPLSLKGIKDPVIFSSADGVGTKVMLAQEFDMHQTIGQDLVAMNVNDLICFGAAPILFVDYIATGKIDTRILKTIVASIAGACKESGCALVGGETAEMPDFYKPGHYDLAGFSCGVVGRRDIVNGTRTKEGDVIVGLASSGLHSNGFSLARKALTKTQRKKYRAQLLAPTRLYVRPVLESRARFDIRHIAHITGGAFLKKLPKVIPAGRDFLIYEGSWRPQEIFDVIRTQARLDFAHMYSTFNMGIGMTLVVAKHECEGLIDFLKSRYRLRAYVIGRVARGNKKIHFV